MPGDQDVTGFLGVVGQTPFHLVLMGIVLGGAGGVQYSEMFQRLPEIPHQKAGQFPEGRIQRVRLMSVSQIQTLALTALLQDDAFIKSQAGKEGLMALGIRAKKEPQTWSE